MIVDIAIRITDPDTNEIVEHRLTNQTSVANAIGYALRGLHDSVPRMEQTIAEIIELVDEQLYASDYPAFDDRCALRTALVDTAEAICDGWEEHDRKLGVGT